MSALASTLIDWSAVWKIVLAALIGGGGVAIAFGLALLALDRAKTARSDGIRAVQRALAGTCGLFCIGAMAIGIYAMVEKSAPKTQKPASAALSHAHRASN